MPIMLSQSSITNSILEIHEIYEWGKIKSLKLLQLYYILTKFPTARVPLFLTTTGKLPKSFAYTKAGLI